MNNRFCHACGDLVESNGSMVQEFRTLNHHCDDTDCTEDVCIICEECQGRGNVIEIEDEELENIFKTLRISAGGSW